MNRRALRLLCFLACVPSIGALLAKVWGIASMRSATLATALPAAILLVAIWNWARRRGDWELADTLAIGFGAGVIATIAYDIARFPFFMAGIRVYGTISAFGIWLLDSYASSRYTETAGWLYHYWNGITFGIMYALMAPRRHWIWAVVWACLLESLAIVSPFGKIFSVAGDYSIMAIAYWGHVAYGVPLGRMVQNWKGTREGIRSIDRPVGWAMAAIACLLTGLYFAGGDPPPQPALFQVDGTYLHPDWLRVQKGASIAVRNPGPGAVHLIVSRTPPQALSASQTLNVPFPNPGIYQVHVETPWRTHSSFVIVEPVEALQ
jgi:hypothetical protein